MGCGEVKGLPKSRRASLVTACAKGNRAGQDGMYLRPAEEVASAGISLRG